MTDKSNHAVLTEKELGARWKIDPRTLRNWRCQGTGPRYLKIGSNIRYQLTEGLRIEAHSLQGAAQ